MYRRDMIVTWMSQNNGLLCTSEALKMGISKTTLSNLARDGQIIRIAHGQYILPDSLPDELYLFQQRIRKAIYSHETALFLHNISERTPARQSVTIPSDTKMRKAYKDDYKVYYVKPDLFELGVMILPTKMGHQVRAYDLERTICDVLRNRSRIDDQVIVAAMKQYASSNKRDFNKLRVYATTFHVTKLLRTYLEVLL
jgi:predicted transcriptional regulator of viral defense system